MIYCPNCGTANKDGSKFCNRCGHDLEGRSKAACPSCGASNPIENLFCDACGSRLAPLVTQGAEEKNRIKGLSLPTKSFGKSADSTEESEASMAPEEDELPIPQEDGGEIPDWMREIGKAARGAADSAEAGQEASADESGEGPSELEGGDVPEWLERLRASAADESAHKETDEVQPEEEEPLAPAPEPEPVSDEGMPDWLKQLRKSAAAEPGQEAVEETPAEEEAGPEAVAAEPQLSAEEPSEEAQPEEAFGEVVEAPEEAPETPVEAEAVSAAPEPSAEEAPAGAEPEEAFEEAPEAPRAAVEAEAVSAVPEPSAEEAPAKAQPEEVPEEAPEVVAEETPAAEVAEAAAPHEETPGPVKEEEQPPAFESELDEATLAAWLQEEGPLILEPEGEEKEEEIVFRQTAPESEALERGEVPQWLESLAPEAAILEEIESGVAEEGKPSPEEAGLERAEIPAWLEELRPGRPRKEEAAPEEAAEESGILAGVHGALRLVDAINPAPAAQTRPESQPVTATASSAELLTSLMAEPVSALTKPRHVRTMLGRERGVPALLFLLILAAVVVPFFVTGIVPGGSTVPFSQPVADMAQAVQALGQGDAVLVSFDYDPGVSTELDRPARIVLDDLRQRGVNLLVMGLNPTGPGLATQLVPAGSQTVFLGYLPGQEMGLQRLALGTSNVFAADFSGNAIAEAPFGVRSLDDLSLILTISASQDTVRWWMEQVGPRVTTPIGAIISAAADPMVRPYYASHQLVGLVSGWIGAQAYGQIANPTAATDNVAMEAQSLAHLLIAALIVLGNIIYWLRRLFGGRQ